MFKLSTRHKYSPIGLDIGTEGVRMLQLRQDGKRLFVSGIAHKRFSKEFVENELDQETRRRQAIETVREILKTGKFHGRKVISCLRADELHIKSIRLPHMSDAELSQAIMWECKERFGFEPSPDRVHYIRAGQVKQGNETRDEIILLAVPENTISAHIEMLSKMHLIPLHVDAEPIALFRAQNRFLQRIEDNTTVSVLVDIGLSKTTIIIAKGRRILLIKIIEIGGRHLNQSVSEELNMSYSAASELRKRLMANPTSTNSSQWHNQPLPQKSEEAITQPQSKQVIWSVSDAIRGCVEALAHEINLCLRYCSVTFRGLRPEKITLMGGQAYDTELVKLMTEYLDTKCVIAQPLLGIDLSEIEAETDRRTELTEWSVATGLVLRNMINNIDVAQKYTSASVPTSIANADNSDHLITADSISRGTNYASDKSN